MKRVLIFVGLLTAILISTQAQNNSFKVEVIGEGKPMILIPGLTCAGEVWDESVKELGGEYEFHVVTLPGFAGQPPIETDNYLETVGDELIEYMKDNKLDRPIVMGHSLGGFLSLYIGAKVPKLVSRLVVVDGLPFLGGLQNPSATPESTKEMAVMMRKNMELQTKEQYEAMQPMMLKSMITDEEDIKTVMEWGRQSDQKTVAQAMYELYQVDLRSELNKIEAPTLVLGAWIAYKNYGATRASTLKLYEMQFENLPQAQIELTDEGKHFIMWDDQEFFFAQVKGFLNGQG